MQQGGKRMIYTVTFNPALDYVMRVPELKKDVVNRTETESFYFGGKGINVSIVLSRLGIKNIALGFVAGFTGREIEEGVIKQGVQTDFIHLPNGLSRINVKIKGIKKKEETDINAQGPEISEADVELLLHKLDALTKEDTLVLAGSIPRTLPENMYENIMERLLEKEVRVVVDATKDLLLNVLKYHPFFIKPNNHELGEMFGKTLENEEDIIFYAKKLQEMGARNVLVSMAAKGAILVTEKNTIYKMGVAKGEVKNSVGAGDSMVAGFIAGYLEKEDYAYALKLGTAAGGATAFSDNVATKEEIEKVMQQL